MRYIFIIAEVRFLLKLKLNYLFYVSVFFSISKHIFSREMSAEWVVSPKDFHSCVVHIQWISMTFTRSSIHRPWPTHASIYRKLFLIHIFFNPNSNLIYFH